jgi:hypothetical protein
MQFTIFCLSVSSLETQKTIILPFVLYRCETWSLTLREGHKMRMFENRAPRRIFGPNRREEVAGSRRRPHDEEL